MPLLLLTCLTIVALDHGKLFVALVIICIAALTKEYGVLLTLSHGPFKHINKKELMSLSAQSYFSRSCVNGCCVVIPFPARCSPSHESFLISQLKYQAFWLYPEYLFNYLKLAYFWACGEQSGPILLLSVWALIKTFRDRSVFTMDELRFGAGHAFRDANSFNRPRLGSNLCVTCPFCLSSSGLLATLREMFDFAFCSASGDCHPQCCVRTTFRIMEKTLRQVLTNLH